MLKCVLRVRIKIYIYFDVRDFFLLNTGIFRDKSFSPGSIKMDRDSWIPESRERNLSVQYTYKLYNNYNTVKSTFILGQYHCFLNVKSFNRNMITSR